MIALAARSPWAGGRCDPPQLIGFMDETLSRAVGVPSLQAIRLEPGTARAPDPERA